MGKAKRAVDDQFDELPGWFRELCFCQVDCAVAIVEAVKLVGDEVVRLREEVARLQKGVG